MSGTIDQIDRLLAQCPYPYENKARIKTDINALLHRNGFQFTLARLGDGNQALLLAQLNGTVPILINNNRYNIPIIIYLPRSYPIAAPVIRVSPTETMVIRATSNVLENGTVQHDYFKDWNFRTATISEALNILSRVFSQECPVYARQQPRRKTPEPDSVQPNPLRQGQNFGNYPSLQPPNSQYKPNMTWAGTMPDTGSEPDIPSPQPSHQFLTKHSEAYENLKEEEAALRQQIENCRKNFYEGEISLNEFLRLIRDYSKEEFLKARLRDKLPN